MNILFTICGRAGSKGIKNKNLRNFLGFPLPFYTVSAIDLFKNQNADKHCDVVLNTDSYNLINMFKNHISLDFDIIERDPMLGLDTTPKIAVISSCLEIMQERKVMEYDLVVDLDFTAPLRTVDDINNLIAKKMISTADVVFSVTDSRRNPYFNMVRKTQDGYVRVISSRFNTRQEAPEIYDMNASLYAFSPSFLMSGKSLFEGRCEVIKMLDTAVLDLDNERDFELMEIIAEYLFQKHPEFMELRENIGNIIKDTR